MAKSVVLQKLNSVSSNDSYAVLDDSNLSPEEKKAKEAFYRSIFELFDKDKTGYIEEEELKEMLKDDNEATRAIVKNIFNGSDNNNDKRLDFNEFVGMIQNRSYKKFFRTYVNMYIRYVLPPNKRRVGPLDDTDGSYEERYSCFPPPIGILLFTAFQLACFITDESIQKDSSDHGTGVTAKIFIYDPLKRGEFWRFFTYMFVHIGYTHLIVNMVIQFVLGFPLEMVHDWWRVILVYCCGVIAGSLGSSIIDPGVCLAGASGGVYALITAHIGTILMNWREMSLAPIQLAFFLMIIIVDIGSSIYNRYWLKPIDQISYTAHIAGAVVGLLVGIWILKNIEPSKRENYMWWIALILFILFMGSMILLNIFWKNRY